MQANPANRPTLSPAHSTTPFLIGFSTKVLVFHHGRGPAPVYFSRCEQTINLRGESYDPNSESGKMTKSKEGLKDDQVKRGLKADGSGSELVSDFMPRLAWQATKFEIVLILSYQESSVPGIAVQGSPIDPWLGGAHPAP
jgi:hypothetical protein